MDSVSNIEKLNEFMGMSITYKEKKDYDNALKYASLATVSTDYPRADTCCQMGEIYLLRNNLEWARFWYEKALGNIYVGIDGDTINEAFMTYIPMLKLSYIYLLNGDIERSYKLNESVLNAYPNNEDALANKKTLDELMNK